MSRSTYARSLGVISFTHEDFYPLEISRSYRLSEDVICVLLRYILSGLVVDTSQACTLPIGVMNIKTLHCSKSHNPIHYTMISSADLYHFPDWVSASLFLHLLCFQDPFSLFYTHHLTTPSAPTTWIVCNGTRLSHDYILLSCPQNRTSFDASIIYCLKFFSPFDFQIWLLVHAAACTRPQPTLVRLLIITDSLSSSLAYNRSITVSPSPGYPTRVHLYIEI